MWQQSVGLNSDNINTEDFNDLFCP